MIFAQIVLISATFIGFIAGFGLILNWFKERQNLAKLFFGLFLLAVAILEYDIWESLYANRSDLWVFDSIALLATTFFFYFYYTLFPKKKWVAKNSYLFLPAFLEIGAQLVRLLDYNVFATEYISPEIYLCFLNEIMEVFNVPFCIFLFISMGYFFLNKEKIATKKAPICIQQTSRERFAIILGVIQVFIVLFWIVSLFNFSVNIDWYEMLIILGLSFLSMYITFEGIRRPEIFHQITQLKTNRRKLKIENTLHADIAAQRILSELKNQQLYRTKDFNLQKLAKQVQLPKAYVSELVNHTLGKTFKVLINQLRIADAKILLVDPDYYNYSVAGIGKEVGFKSDSAFFNWFKKETQMTPTQYKNKYFSVLNALNPS